jgi:hypothetical protein
MISIFCSSTRLLPTRLAIFHFLYEIYINKPVLYCRAHFTHVFCTQKVHIADPFFNDYKLVLPMHYLVVYRKQNERETILTNSKT